MATSHKITIVGFRSFFEYLPLNIGRSQWLSVVLSGSQWFSVDTCHDAHSK